MRNNFTATDIWRLLIQDLLESGAEIRQSGRAHEPRSRTT